MPLLQTSERGGIFSLCLDNPPAHALSRRLVTEMESALSSLEKAEPRALILTASGDRFFSAGLDLIELYELKRPAIEAFSRQFLEIFLRVFRFPVPVVAA